MTLQEKFGKDRVIFFPIDLTNMEVYKGIELSNLLNIFLIKLFINHDITLLYF